jgi:hypothetical protein
MVYFTEKQLVLAEGANYSILIGVSLAFFPTSQSSALVSVQGDSIGVLYRNQSFLRSSSTMRD